MTHIMVFLDKETEPSNFMLSKLKSRGYDLSILINPNFEDNSFKENLNNLNPEDYLISIGSCVNLGVKVLENKIRNIEAAFFVVNQEFEFFKSLKAKKVFIYGNYFAESFSEKFDVSAFIEDEESSIFEEILIDIISLEH
jgi:hypothetical protein